MLKKTAFFIILLLIFFILLGISTVIISSKLRYYLYKEIGYQYLADKISKGAKSDEEKVLRIFSYIHDNLNAVGGQVVDKDTWNDLVRGIAWCDQQSWDFATLLSKENISARFVMLKDKEGVSPHTIAEVFLGGKWIALDPLYGLVFRKDNGNLVTLEEISRDPSILTKNPIVLLLPDDKRNGFLATYARVIPLPMEPRRWAPLLEKKNSNIYQRIVNLAIKNCVRIFGKYLVNPYQDLYLALNSNIYNSQEEALYFKARNYHLYYRIHSAENLYKKIIINYPQTKYAENSQFFLGLLNAEVKKDYKVAIEEFHRLLNKYPNTEWSIVARYFLGKTYEAVGDLENAKLNYSYFAYNLDTDAAWRLSNLSKKSR